MLKLNLLSEEIKKEIKLLHVYKMLRKANYFLIIIIIFIAIIMLVAKVILQNNFNRIVSETTLITKNSQSFSEKARNINSKLQMIEDIQKKNVIWSLLIQDIAKIMPENVSLNSLKIEYATNTIYFKGKAADRGGLISFKESLEKKDYFKEINFPIENILEKENVIYDFFVKFDGNKIKKISDI